MPRPRARQLQPGPPSRGEDVAGVTTTYGKKCEKKVLVENLGKFYAARTGSGSGRKTARSLKILIRVAERFFSGVPQPPPPWRLLPESIFLVKGKRGLVVTRPSKSSLQVVPPNSSFQLVFQNRRKWVEIADLLMVMGLRLAMESAFIGGCRFVSV
jgi:hypothetical protein